MTTTDGKLLAIDMRRTARLVVDLAREQPCWSVIQNAVTTMSDHITAIAGNIEKNAAIHQLENAMAMRKPKPSPSNKGKIKTAVQVTKKKSRKLPAKSK